MFQTSSGFNFKSVLNFIHFLYDSGPNCLLFISDDSYREILTVILVHSLSFVFLYMCQMPFYTGYCIYILGQAFLT